MAFSGRGGVAGWGRLVVFASGKNRAIAGRPLHSNFNLNAKGEYLALFPPTGNTPTTAFAPSYPARRPDVSFGTGLREIAALRVEDSRASRPSLPLPPANDVDCNGIQEPLGGGIKTLRWAFTGNSDTQRNFRLRLRLRGVF